MIAVLWEGAYASGYNIYLGSEKENLQKFYSVENKKNADTDRFSGKEMKGVRYVKVETTGQTTTWGVKINDLKLYGICEAESVPTTIEVSEITGNKNVNEVVNLSAKVLDQFGAEMADQAVTFSCEDTNATIDNESKTFTASAMGAYTVTATCGSINTTFTINVTEIVTVGYNLQANPYATMILPFDVNDFNTDAYKGYHAYSVNGAQDEQNGYVVLYLNEVTTLKANTPYILYWAGKEEGGDGIRTFVYSATKKYDSKTYTDGWLTGVMAEEGTQAPQGSYVLQNQEGKLGFYKVTTDDIKVGAYRAYPNPEKTSADVKAFVFDLNDVDAIENIATSEVLVNVYDLNGVVVRKNVKACEALQGLKKGIYVVNGAKKAVK